MNLATSFTRLIPLTLAALVSGTAFGQDVPRTQEPAPPKYPAPTPVPRTPEPAPPSAPPSRVAPSGHCETCGAAATTGKCPTCGAPLRAEPAAPADPNADERLRKTLKREYGEEPAPPPGPTPPAEGGPSDAGAVPPSEEAEDEGGFHFRLNALVAHWSAHLLETRVASQRHGFGTGRAFHLENMLPGLGDDFIDGGRFETQLYRLGIDFFSRVGIQGQFHREVFRDTGPTHETVDYSGILFMQGTPVAAMLETRVADIDLVAHVVKERPLKFDITLGARYVYVDTRIRPAFPVPFHVNAERSHESVLPMIGAALTFAPIPELQFFARARIGGWYWEDHGDSGHRGRRFSNGGVQYATSGEGDAGIKVIFAETVGVVVGYRIDSIKMLDESSPGNRRRTEVAEHGPYGGLVVEF